MWSSKKKNWNTKAVSMPKRTTDKIKRGLSHSISFLILGAWTLFLVYSFGWILASSVSTTREIFTDKLLASGVHFKNYISVLTTNHLGKYFINSLIYCTISCVGMLVLATPTSYILSRANFPGRKIVTGIFVAGMGIPGMMTMIPLFMMFTRLGLVKSFAGLLIIYICGGIPFTVFFLSGFFSSLPTELEEAAIIDGATPFQAFRLIMLPLAQGALVTVTVFNFLSLWGEYSWALIMVNDERYRTLQIGLQIVMRSMLNQGNYAGIFAGIVLVFLPTLLIYIFLSEKIVSNITAGAIKS
jgi:N-acetylglucosamine transport system permease protein